MLPKRSRLTAQQVEEVLKSGKTARLAGLSAKYMPGASPKAAVVVSKKVAKGAVERNRLRRAAYAALARALPQDRHVVFFLHQPALDPAQLRSLCSKLS